MGWLNDVHASGQDFSLTTTILWCGIILAEPLANQVVRRFPLAKVLSAGILVWSIVSLLSSSSSTCSNPPPAFVWSRVFSKNSSDSGDPLPVGLLRESDRESDRPDLLLTFAGTSPRRDHRPVVQDLGTAIRRKYLAGHARNVKHHYLTPSIRLLPCPKW